MRGDALQVEGLKEVLENIKNLYPEIQEKSGRSAMRQVGKEMRNEILKRVPVDQGDLKGSIREKLPKVEPWGVRVSAIADYAKGGNHAHLVEYGHKQVFKLRNGKKIVIGTEEPAPFIRPALYHNAEKYVGTAAIGIEKALVKLERKAIKNGTRFRK